MTPFDLMFSIPTGMVQAGEIIFGGLMIGALFSVIERTGLLTLGIQRINKAFQTRSIWVIPVLMIPMATFTAFTGAMEMGLMYAPIMIPLPSRSRNHTDSKCGATYTWLSCRLYCARPRYFEY